MSGSQQFLGRQLADQAEALGTLVDKMGQMVTAQEQSIGKFATASNNIKSEKDFSTPQGINNTSGFTFVTFVSGTIRIVLESENTNSTSSKTHAIFVNGVNSGSFSISPSTIETNQIDIAVKEGDVVGIFTTDITTGYIHNIKVLYDLTNKPEIAI